MNKKLISSILFVKNGEKYIEQNLDSQIRSLRNYDYEIIISDNGSTDKTLDIIKNKYSNTIKVVSSSLERSRQVNEAARVISGKYIYITGVDIHYNPKYFSEAIELLEGNEGLDAIYTSVITDDSGLIAKIKKYERELYLGDDNHESARFVKRQVFNAIGGYDEEIVAGEDYDFQRRLNKAGYKTGRVSEIAEYHLQEEESWLGVWRRAYYYGKTLPKFFQKNGLAGVVQMSPIRLNYFSWGAIKRPDLWIGLILYKLVQLIAAMTAMIYMYCGKLLGAFKKRINFFIRRRVFLKVFFLKVSFLIPSKRNSIRSILTTIKKNEGIVFIQIGANDGISGNPLYEFYKVARGVAVEPVPYVFDQLSKNLKKFKEINCINAAITYDLEKYKKIYFLRKNNFLNPGYDQIGSFDYDHLIKHNEFFGKKYIEIFKSLIESKEMLSININELLERNPNTNVVYMDVEGFDTDLLNNLETRNLLNIKHIFFEYVHSGFEKLAQAREKLKINEFVFMGQYDGTEYWKK